LAFAITTSEAYSSIFKVVVVLLSAVGLILTPIYLLSMLRRVFYGNMNSELQIEKYLGDANPREIFITACLLVPIIGIGLYPKIATQTYDVKTVAVTAQVRQVLPLVAQQKESARTASLPRLSSGTLTAPQLPTAKAHPLLGVMK
jgi:NAD(P)H-quinone oxidoreductase subunit 4